MVKRIRLAIIFVMIVACLLIATPAYADTPDPDSDPTIEDFNVYRNMLETGDFLLLIYANIPYATLPDTPVSQTFIWRLMALDGVTTLGTTVGTDYNDDGYGYNVWSMYFSAAEVTALGIVWGTAYPVRLSGNPAVFDTTPVYNFSLAAADYSTETETAEVQAELALRVITIATDLNNKWGLPADERLVGEYEAGRALSTFGESFFRGAIYGLQGLAPGAFSVEIRVIDIDPRAWSDAHAANVTGQWDGTWVQTAKESGKVLFGTDYDLLSIIILLSMCVGLLYGNIMLTGDFWNGLIDVSLVAVIGARLAMYDLMFLGLITALCWIFIGTKVWFGMFKP